MRLSALFLGLSALVPCMLRAGSITIDKIQYNTQTSASAPAPETTPYKFIFTIHGETSYPMNNWGPAFYLPGSSGMPQSGSSSSSNTGTVNFSTTPNLGADFAFIDTFSSASALETAYPAGQYGVKFLGTTPPTPATFTAALNYDSGTYPVTAPQVVSADNGATWTGGVLTINPSGTTTLTINDFAEYTTNANGAFVGVGIYRTNEVIGTASIEAYNLPTLGQHDPKPTQITINGDWLTAGLTYTLEIQYAVIASAPQQASLTAPGASTASTYQGLATYRKNTLVTVAVASTASTTVGIKNDFNGDGKSDLVWSNTSNGDRYLWLMNGGTVSSSVFLGTIAPAWTAVTGDFNGDGKVDIVWSNTSNGDRYLWLMNGGTVSSSVFLGTVAPTWTVITGDFNGDGKADLVWSNTSNGDRYLWLMNGGTVSSSVFLGTVAPAWTAITGDFNGDGKADLLWSNSSNGDRYLWLMNGGTVSSNVFLGTVAPAWTAITGDFNGDGKADLVWSNTANGDRYLWLMSGGTVSSSVFLGTVAPAWTAVTGDLNGDSKADLVWSNTANGDRYVWLMNGGTVSSSVFLGTVAPAWSVSN